MCKIMYSSERNQMKIQKSEFEKLIRPRIFGDVGTGRNLALNYVSFFSDIGSTLFGLREASPV